MRGHASELIYLRLRDGTSLANDGTSLANFAGSDPTDNDVRPNMKPSVDRVSNEHDGSRARHFDSREWPRFEPAFTHFELGASTASLPTAVMAKRYTPRYGVRKE